MRRCSAQGDIEAWEEFVRRFHRLIAVVVMRTAQGLGDSSTQTIDDLIQETYLKLCADDFTVLRNFQQRHPGAFIGFIKIVAANVVRDHFKLSRSHKRGANRLQEAPEHFNPAAPEDSLGSPKAMERAVLVQEIQQHLDHCLPETDRDRNMRIFWLHYRVGLSAGAIAALPGIGLTTKGVESLILRMTRELREQIGAAKPKKQDSTRTTSEGIFPAESF